MSGDVSRILGCTMMKRYLLISGLLCLLGMGFWCGRAAWRAHKNLVSLEVRDVPLREVVRQFERQTWETIHLDHRLDGKVTLCLKEVPLADALGQLAAEVGAQAATIHAVHRSPAALHRLEAALAGGQRIGGAGWTNLAPCLTAGRPMLAATNQGLAADVGRQVREQLAANGLNQLLSSGILENALQQALTGTVAVLPTGAVTVAMGHPQVLVIPGGVDAAGLPDGLSAAVSNLVRESFAGAKSGSVTRTVRQSSMVAPPLVTVTRRGRDGSLESDEPELLAPERIVIELALDQQRTNRAGMSPTQASAQRVAQALHARCTTLYALTQSELPGFLLRSLRARPPAQSAGPGAADPAQAAQRLAAEVQREQAERYLKLTPEQRARRAREQRLPERAGSAR